MKEEARHDPGQARVFFALWPDDDLRKALVRATGQMYGQHGGRQTRPDSIHLTLVFIGQVDQARIPELLAMAHSIQVAHFDAVFDKAECWRHNHVGCLGTTEVPDKLLSLVKALESGLKALDIPFDKRPYKPHITLLRKADCRREVDLTVKERGKEMKNPALGPIHWPARDFVLVKSSLRPDGARYEELGRWPLL